MKAKLVYRAYADAYEIHITLLGLNLVIVPVKGVRNIIGTSNLDEWPLAIDTFEEKQ